MVQAHKSQLNVRKSATLAIVADKKRKRWLCDGRPILEFGGETVVGMRASEIYRYLGTDLGSVSRVCSVRAVLEDGLRQLRTAPLKPQQRFQILTGHLIPKLTHRLMLDERLPGSLLRSVDRSVRRAVREWLHLSKDVPNSYIHAAVKDGGLGVAQQTVQARLLRKRRVESLVSRAQTGHDPVLSWLVNNETTLVSELNRHSMVPSYGVPVTNNSGHKAAAAVALHGTCDGRGLQQSSVSPNLNRWIRGEGVSQTGRAYVGCMQVRANTLQTAGRCARGSNRGLPWCDCCGRYDSLGHRLQVCPRCYSTRIERHDALVKLTRDRLESRGWRTLVEPTIKTRAGVRRPDLIVWRSGECLVIDIAVVSDNAILDREVELKRLYYNIPEITEYAAQAASVDQSAVSYTAVVLNWRGTLARESFEVLQRCGLLPYECELFVIRTLEFGYRAYVLSSKSAMREPVSLAKTLTAWSQFRAMRIVGRTE